MVIQISGNFVVAKEALAEIASRLRMRTLRDANTGSESNPVRSVHGFGSIGSLPAKEPPPSGPMQGGNSGGYEHLWVLIFFQFPALVHCVLSIGKFNC